MYVCFPAYYILLELLLRCRYGCKKYHHYFRYMFTPGDGRIGRMDVVGQWISFQRRKDGCRWPMDILNTPTYLSIPAVCMYVYTSRRTLPFSEQASLRSCSFSATMILSASPQSTRHSERLGSSSDGAQLTVSSKEFHTGPLGKDENITSHGARPCTAYHHIRYNCRIKWPTSLPLPVATPHTINQYVDSMSKI